MMSDLDKLIRDLEGATEGSRVLDGKIALFLGWVKHHAGWAHWTTPEGLENQHVPFFSDSLDDAMLLISSDCYPTIMAWLSPKSEYGSVRMKVRGPFKKNGWHEDRLGEGKTAPLAVCIAALKGRQAIAALKARKEGK